MRALWQEVALDRPHEGDFAGSSCIVGPLSGVEILRIVPHRCAMQLRGGSHRRARTLRRVTSEAATANGRAPLEGSFDLSLDVSGRYLRLDLDVVGDAKYALQLLDRRLGKRLLILPVG